MRIPKHIGVIPDGNRRWAKEHDMTKESGYEKGLDPGLRLYRLCKQLGVEEISYYGFTVDNTKRPKIQRLAFTQACVEAVKLLENEDAQLLVLGNQKSAMFPPELVPYTTRQKLGSGGLKVNFLVNYSWEWDLNLNDTEKKGINSSEVSRIDLLIRWGGRQRLSGFLPVQSVYSDFYFIDDFWPGYEDSHVLDALKWYNTQDVTLGG